MHGCDVGVSIDLDMGDQRKAPDLSTQGDGTPAISSSSLTSSSEMVGASLFLSLPLTIAFARGMTLVSREFL